MADKNYKLRIKTIKIPIQIQQKADKITIPGMNMNSNNAGNEVKSEAINRRETQQRLAKEKENQILSRSEMRSVLVGDISRKDAIRGKKPEYILKPQVIGMSGRDPLLGFAVDMVGFGGLNALGKTVLWLAAKHAPKTQLGKWGRSYFINKVMNNSFGKTPETVSFSLRIYEDMDGSPINLDEVYSYALDNHVPYKYRLPKRKLSETEQRAFNSQNFIHKGDMDIGEFNKAFGQEILDRLKGLGYNVETPVVVKEKGINNIRTPKRYVEETVQKPVSIGYFTEEHGPLGMYIPNTDLAAVDIIDNQIVPLVALHERVSHGTDALLRALEEQEGGAAVSLYRDMINKLFYTPEGKLHPNIKEVNKELISSDGRKINPDSKGWEDLRATVLENKRQILMALKRKNPSLKGKPLSEYRKPYLEMLDERTGLSDETLGGLLKHTNGYGLDYFHLRNNNPFFYRDYRDLLRYGAMFGAPTTLLNTK